MVRTACGSCVPFTGLGFATAGQKAEGAGISIGTAAAGGFIAGGPIGAAVGAAIAGVSALVGLIFGNQAQYHAQEAATTQDANQIEKQMQANLAMYAAGQIDQQTALDNFDKLWAALEQACQTQQMGDPGKRCISDRQAGACVWKNDGKGGPVGSGNVCWNWFVGYRQPIESGTTTAAATSPPGFSLSPTLLLVAGGSLLLLAEISE